MAETEVHFWFWCPKCKHYKNTETEPPCDDCLDCPVNEDSSKPVEYEEA